MTSLIYIKKNDAYLIYIYIYIYINDTSLISRTLIYIYICICIYIYIYIYIYINDTSLILRCYSLHDITNIAVLSVHLHAISPFYIPSLANISDR